MFDPSAQPPARCNKLRVDFGEGGKLEFSEDKPQIRLSSTQNSAHILFAEVGGVKEDRNANLAPQAHSTGYTEMGTHPDIRLI